MSLPPSYTQGEANSGKLWTTEKVNENIILFSFELLMSSLD